MKRLLLIFACCISIFSLFAEIQRPLLITGCGRSGTGYISQVFRLCGYEVLHEQIGAFGISSWEMNFESDWVPWGAPRKNIKFEHVFHQVRHPLDAISSMYVTNPLSSPSWIYIFQMIPEMTPTDSLLTTCVKYWYYWNIHAEEQAELTYRVEAITDVWEDIEWILGITLDKSVLDRVSIKTNTRIPNKHYFTWDELREQLNPYLFAKIEELAYYYGYDTK